LPEGLTGDVEGPEGLEELDLEDLEDLEDPDLEDTTRFLSNSKLKV